MTRDVSPDLQTIRLFFTQPHTCSYLPEREATTAFVDPALAVDNRLYSQLTHMGFRRSGKYYYAPRCRRCQACISTRIPVARFKPNRQQRKCVRHNRDIEVRQRRSVDFEEHYRLYERYIRERHQDGDMYPPTFAQYLDFLGQGVEQTRHVEFRRNGQLLGCTVMDVLDDGLSAIYTYFDPDQHKRSLGTFAILALVDIAAHSGRPYVYLGFWVDGCSKMDYKTNFRPLEQLTGQNWVDLV